MCSIICALFELDIIQQVLASLNAIRKIDIPGRSNGNNMRMFAERLEGYRVVAFPSRFT